MLERGTAVGLLVATGVILGIGAAMVAVTIPVDMAIIGQDFRFYRAIGERWLADGSFYLPHELAGPYQLQLMVDVLYPPTALFLFVPLALLPDVLDAFLWWCIPIGVLVYQFARMRPAPLTWPILALLLAWPRTWGNVLWGNTDMGLRLLLAGARSGVGRLRSLFSSRPLHRSGLSASADVHGGLR